MFKIKGDIMRSKTFRLLDIQMDKAYEAVEGAARDQIALTLIELSKARRYSLGVEFISGNGVWFFSLLSVEDARGRPVKIEVRSIENMLQDILDKYGWRSVPTGRIRAIAGHIDPHWNMNW